MCEEGDEEEVCDEGVEACGEGSEDEEVCDEGVEACEGGEGEVRVIRCVIR